MSKPSLIGKIYTYEILVDGVVRYIGKGSGYRAKSHIALAKRINKVRSQGQTFKASKFHNKLARAMRLGSGVDFRIVSFFDSHEDALNHEIGLISSAKEIWNQKEGGEGGLVADDDLRIKLSEAAKNRYSDPLEREKTSKALKEAFDNDYMRNKMASQARELWQNNRDVMLKAIKSMHKNKEANAKKSAYQKKRWENEELRDNMSKWSKAIWYDAEQKKAHVEALKESWKSLDRRAKHRAYFDSEKGKENLRRAAKAAAASRASNRIRRIVTRGAPIWAGVTRIHENAT